MAKFQYGFGESRTPIFYAKLATVFTFYKIEDGEDKPLTMTEIKEVIYDVREYLAKFGINGHKLTASQLDEVVFGLVIPLLNTDIDDDGSIEGMELRDFYLNLIEYFEEVAEVLGFTEDAIVEPEKDVKTEPSKEEVRGSRSTK